MSVRFHIKENSWIGRLAAWKLGAEKVAIVIGRTIHLHNTHRDEFLQNRRWVLHELKHLEQFRRYGFIRFIFLYLWESIRHGYFNNKYEIEAREAEELQDASVVSRLKCCFKKLRASRPIV